MPSSHLTGRCGPRVFVMAAMAALALPLPALAQDEPPPRLRWELVTNGASNLGSRESTTPESPIPKLTGSDATFLFRLDAQPLLNYGPVQDAGAARLSMHLTFETGIISVGRAVTAMPDTATSPAVEALRHQGADVTAATASGTALTRQRAFTSGVEFSANRLYSAQGTGAFMEIGGVAKGYVDAFLDDQRFFEKDGISYVKVSSPLGSETSYFRGEIGFRFRLTQMEEEENRAEVGEMMKGGNVDDLLLFELLYQRNNAVEGVVPDSDLNTANRWVMRFKATPEIPGDAMDMKHVKLLLGIEVTNDLRNRGKKDVRVFYGANVDLKRLF